MGILLLVLVPVVAVCSVGSRQQATGNGERRSGNRSALGILLLVLVLALLSAAAVAEPASHDQKRRVTVIVANRLLLSDLVDCRLPTIRKMIRGGAVGLISPNCIGAKTEASVMMTANAGSPAKGGAFTRELYDWSEPLPDGTTAGGAYAFRTGRRAHPGSAVFLGLGQALRENAKYSVLPPPLGGLGDALVKAGRRALVLGNADLNEPGRDPTVDRSAAVLAMDSAGLVHYGGLSSHPNPSTEHKPVDLTVICFGDSVRLDEAKMSVSDAALGKRREEMLWRLESLLRRFSLPAEWWGDPIILVSFSPPSGLPWDQLTPIVVYNGRDAGMLTSASTRTPGVIGAADFAPTILNLMRVPQTDAMIGRPAAILRQPNAADALTQVGKRVTTNQRLLLPMGVFVAALGALSFTAAALVVAFRLRPSNKALALVRSGLVVSACAAGALYLGSMGPPGAAGYVTATAAAFLLLSLACLVLTRLLRPRTHVRALPIVIAYGLTAVIILIDALTGCNLCEWCAVSSYQISGMRFYGIGNEFAGVLIGMTAVTTLYLRDWRWLAPAAGLVTALALGWGSLGANYGAVPCIVVTFTLMWFAITRKGFGARHVLLAFFTGIAALIALAVADLRLSGSAGTHMAQATSLTEKLGSGYILSVALRKALFNLKTTFGDKGLSTMLAFVPFLVIWFWKLRDKVRELFKDDPRVMAGIKAILVGSVVAYVLEDSGIVFASVIVAMTVLVLLYSVLEALTVESGERRAQGAAPSPPGEGAA